MSSPRRYWLVAGSLVFAIGCDAFDNLEDSGARVHVFSTHHATPGEDGLIPFRGNPDEARIFENDLGWTIILADPFITTAAVTLVGCNGSNHPLTMFWGPCPEDLRERDLDILSVAGRSVSAGSYCSLEVEYGPYVTPVINEDAGESRHSLPSNEAIDGASIYLRGSAEREGVDPVIFELRSTDSIDVELDLSEIDGGNPLKITNSEDFPIELTVSKTYDRFFDGVDFSALDMDALNGQLDDILVDETFVIEGTVVQDQGD